MGTRFTFPTRLKYLTWFLIFSGFVGIYISFRNDPHHGWSTLLLNSFYFLSLSLGALFFISVQYVTESGWATMFKKIPEAMAPFLIVSGIGMILVLFGMKHIYHWTEHGILEHDALIAHKAPYLNVPFFAIRLLAWLAIWLVLWLIYKKYSMNEDSQGGIKWFEKSRVHARVFIFVFVITFSFASFDWIMSIDSHWFSTIFGVRALISALYFAVATIILIALYLNKIGYLKELNISHRHDFARYLFRFSIAFGYLWFMQFMIIWYANIPEDTAYYYPRVKGAWSILFYAEFLLNWTLPFLVLMSDNFARKRMVLATMSALLLVGFYISLFLQIMPGTIGEFSFGMADVLVFLGFGGGFILTTMYTLSKSTLMPVHHPYLQESLKHDLHLH